MNEKAISIYTDTPVFLPGEGRIRSIISRLISSISNKGGVKLMDAETPSESHLQMETIGRALIVYASLTGNTEEIAELLAQSLKKKGIEAILEECTQVYPKEFQEFDICVVATYTYGSDGDLPDEIEDFYVELADVDLSGKIYGVLGSGETIYDKFCQSVDDFDEQFEKTSALRGAEMLKVDLDAEVEDVNNIEEFADSLVKTYKEAKGLS